MSATTLLFATAMLVGSAFLLVMTWKELDVRGSGFRQVGESSLGRNSINWLAGIALVGAITICLLAK